MNAKGSRGLEGGCTYRSERDTKSARTISDKLRMKPEPTPWNVRPTSMRLETTNVTNSVRQCRTRAEGDVARANNALHGLGRTAHGGADREQGQPNEEDGSTSEYVGEASAPGNERRRTDPGGGSARDLCVGGTRRAGRGAYE